MLPKRILLKVLLILSTEILFYTPLFSKNVLIGNFIPHASEKNLEIERQIQESLKRELSQKKLTVSFANEIRDKIFQSSNQENKFYLEGQYTKTKDSPLSLYIQIYDPSSGKIIDAMSESLSLKSIEGVELDATEINRSNQEIIDIIAKQVAIDLELNPEKKESRENIQDHLISKPIYKQGQFNISQIDKKEEARQAFKLIEEQTVVTASRNSEKISDAPSTVVVITKEMIKERGYRSLIDILQDVPGFEFNHSHDSGEYLTDFSVRGVNGQSKVLFLENGIAQNDIANQWLRNMEMDYTLTDIERVEIILGPGSSLYGSSAYAALINVITKKPGQHFNGKTNKISTDIRAFGGKYRTQSVDSLIAYKFENGLAMQIAARHYKTNGDRGINRHDPANFWHNNYEPDTIQTSEYGNIANDKYPGNVRKKIPDGFNTSKNDMYLRGSAEYKNFTLGFNYWDIKDGLGSYTTSYEYFTNSPGVINLRHHRGGYLYAGHEAALTKNLNVQTKVYTRTSSILPDTGFVYTYRYQSVDNPVVDGVAKPYIPDKAKQYQGQSYMSGIQQQYNHKLTSTNQAVYGFLLEYYQKGIFDTGISLGKRQNTNSTLIENRWEDMKPGVTHVYYSQSMAVYIQDTQQIGNRYSFVAGGRYDGDTEYGRVYTPHLALIGNPYNQFRFKLLYGQAFKAPTSYNLHDEFVGNRNLKPERISTTELELSYSFATNGLIKTNHFMSQLSNTIELAPNPNDGRYLIGAASQHLEYFQNINPTHIYGSSIELSYIPIKNLNLAMNYLILGDRDSRITVNYNGYSLPIQEGHDIFNVASKKFNVSITYTFFEKLIVNLRMNYVSRRKAEYANRYFQPYDPDFARNNYEYMNAGKPNGYIPEYTIYNFTVTYRNLFGIENLEPQLIVRNALNQNYMGAGVGGSAVRPVDHLQPSIQNPQGVLSGYFPQPLREIFFQLNYKY